MALPAGPSSGFVCRMGDTECWVDQVVPSWGVLFHFAGGYGQTALPTSTKGMGAQQYRADYKTVD